MKNTKFIRKLAIDLARQSNFKRYNFVSVITDKKNKILSIGMNHYNKTHPLQAKYAKQENEVERIYLHSEIDALSKCKHIVPYKIFIARANRSGQIKPASPCKICRRAITESGIKEIWYSVDNGFASERI